MKLKHLFISFAGLLSLSLASGASAMCTYQIFPSGNNQVWTDITTARGYEAHQKTTNGPDQNKQCWGNNGNGKPLKDVQITTSMDNWIFNNSRPAVLNTRLAIDPHGWLVVTVDNVDINYHKPSNYYYDSVSWNITVEDHQENGSAQAYHFTCKGVPTDRWSMTMYPVCS